MTMSLNPLAADTNVSININLGFENVRAALESAQEALKSTGGNIHAALRQFVTSISDSLPRTEAQQNSRAGAHGMSIGADFRPQLDPEMLLKAAFAIYDVGFRIAAGGYETPEERKQRETAEQQAAAKREEEMRAAEALRQKQRAEQELRLLRQLMQAAQNHSLNYGSENKLNAIRELQGA
jgi:hypothetical protein